MNNFTKETYQMKREILTFSKKIANGTRKVTLKFTEDMVYGILARKNCYLSAMGTGIKEILKNARTEIREWQHIETREKYKQLELKL